MNQNIKVDLTQVATNTFAGRLGSYFGYNKKEFIPDSREHGIPSVVYSSILKEEHSLNMAFYVGKIKTFYLQSLLDVKRVKKTDLYISYENAYALCSSLGATDFGYVFDFDHVSWVAYRDSDYRGIGGIVCKDGADLFIIEPYKNFLKTRFPKEEAAEESDSVYVD